MKRIINLVVLYLVILIAVSVKNLSQHPLSSHSSQKKQNNRTDAPTEQQSCRIQEENDNLSNDSESSSGVLRNLSLGSAAVSRESDLSSSPIPSIDLASNNPHLISIPNYVEITRGHGSYKRVYVGKDSSGGNIYASAAKLDHALSLARYVHKLYASLEKLQKHGDIKTGDDGRPKISSKPSTAQNTTSNESLDITMNRHPSFDVFQNTHNRRDRKENGLRNVQCSVSSGSLAIRGLHQTPNISSPSDSEQTRVSGQHIQSDAPVTIPFVNSTIICPSQTLNKTSPIDVEEAGAPSASVQSDSTIAQEDSHEILPSRLIFPEFNDASSPSTSRKNYSTRKGAGETDSRIDNSLSNFVTAVNALQSLVEDLDEYFGSARRLRTSLMTRRQESFDLLTEICQQIWTMSSLRNSETRKRFGIESKDRLMNVSDTVMFVNNEIECYTAGFHNGGTGELESWRVYYLLFILRKLRNEVATVIESAQLVMEYFHELVNDL